MAELPSEPAPTSAPRISLSEESLRHLAGVFEAQLDSFQSDLASLAASPVARPPEALELPEGLHVAFAAWGLDGFGGGELAARFSWCGRGIHGMAEVRWPAGVLPMVEVLAASQTRRIP